MEIMRLRGPNYVGSLIEVRPDILVGLLRNTRIAASVSATNYPPPLNIIRFDDAFCSDCWVGLTSSAGSGEAQNCGEHLPGRQPAVVVNAVDNPAAFTTPVVQPGNRL